jgi:parallel beta-helix repeat protein
MRFIIALILTHLSLASAGDFYVAVTGRDDAAGSKAEPWRTIQHAAKSLKPGDTAHVLPGAYTEKVQIAVSGTAGKPVTFQAEGAVVVSGKGVKGENIFLVENQSHVRVIGFEIRDNLKCNDGSGIRVQGAGTHIEIRNCRVHEIRGKDAMGITVYGDQETPLSNITIDGNEVFNCDPARSEALTLNGNITGFRVTNNVVRDMNNIGIDFIGGEQWANKDRTKVVRDGVCSGNRVMRCRSNYEDGYAAGIYVDGGRDIVIEKNTVTECDLGIEIGAENRGTVTSGVIVRNNLIYRNDKAGLVFGGYEKGAGRVQQCAFTGNTCYQNHQHEDQNGELWIQWASDNKITGNIFWSGEENPLVQVDANAGRNEMNGNRYYSEAGEEEAYFIWKGKDVNGLRAWRVSSGLDSASVFERPDIALPATR